MKFTKTLLCAAVAGAMAFGATKASAANPADCLIVKSLTAKFTVTTNYSQLYSTNVNSAKPLTKSMSLKQVMQIITNAVAKSTGTNPPADVKLAWNPYGSSYMFLTNSSGYSQQVDIWDGTNYIGASASVEDIATSFKSNDTGGSEKDTIVFYLDIYGYDLNGQFFEIYQDYGTGTLTFNVPNNNTGVGNMVIQSKGGGYGALKDSDDGVSSGNITLQGKLAAQGDEPYSLWWY